MPWESWRLHSARGLGVSWSAVPSVGRGGPRVPLGQLPPSTSPQFSGLWYEIALASNLEPQTPPQLKKMGAVLVEREGPYLTLTSVSDQ